MKSRVGGSSFLYKKGFIMEKKLSYEDGRELFVEKLCKLMSEKNLSCKYLSNKIKKNDGYINRIINGKIDPSFEVIFDIAAALKIPVAELFE